MANKSSNTKEILKNTIVLYFRMIVLLLVNLYTSRVVLDALGVEDYGIYNVVGGIVLMFTVISSPLTSAITRFLNFEMGKRNFGRQNLVFSTILYVQWVLALIIFIFSEVIGIWYVNNIMVLPLDRMVAANWCFQISVLTFCTNLITVPYNASIIAHEDMKIFALISIYEGLAKLCISFIILYEPFDRLKYYALLLFIVQYSVRLSYRVYCRKKYEECKYTRTIDKQLLKQLLSYSIWHLIGNGAGVLKTHGVNIVLNLFFGPTVNAAKGVANQVDNAVQGFIGNFMMAMNPQITQSYAKGDFKYMFNLVYKGARFSFYIFIFFAIPIIINTEYIMNVWLKEVPRYAVSFAKLTLVSMMISTLSRTLITAQNATGNVRNYQLVVGGVQLLNLPVSYFFLYLGYPPTVVIYVAIGVEILALIARIIMLPYTIPLFQRLDFLYKVVIRCFIVCMVAICFPYLLKNIMVESFLSFCLNVFVCFGSILASVLFIGCAKDERNMLFSKCKSYILKKI